MKKYRIRANSIAARVLELEWKLNHNVHGLLVMVVIGLMLAGIFAWGMNGIHPF